MLRKLLHDPQSGLLLGGVVLVAAAEWIGVFFGTDYAGFRALYPIGFAIALGSLLSDLFRRFVQLKADAVWDEFHGLMPKSMMPDRDSRTVTVERHNGEVVVLQVPDDRMPSPMWILEQLLPPEHLHRIQAVSGPFGPMLLDDEDDE